MIHVPTWLEWVLCVAFAIPALVVIGAAVLFIIAISGTDNPFR